MDEADTLADRVMIMSEGRLRCSGSPLFLKTRFGAGYLLSMAKTNGGCDTEAVTAAVRAVVPTASLAQAVAGELIYQLPLQAVPAFAELFQRLKVRLYTISIYTIYTIYIPIFVYSP